MGKKKGKKKGGAGGEEAGDQQPSTSSAPPPVVAPAPVVEEPPEGGKKRGKGKSEEQPTMLESGVAPMSYAAPQSSVPPAPYAVPQASGPVPMRFVVPQQNVAPVHFTLPPPSTQPVQYAVQPPSTIPVAVQPPGAAPVQYAVPPPSTQPVQYAVQLPGTQPVQYTVPPPSTQPAQYAVQLPGTQPVQYTVPPPSTQPVQYAVQLPGTQPVQYTVPPPSTQPAQYAVPPPSTQPVQYAVQLPGTQPVQYTVPPPSTQPAQYGVPPPSTPARFVVPQLSMPPVRFSVSQPTMAPLPFAVAQPSAAPVPQSEVYGATGGEEATGGARKKRGKGGKAAAAAQVEQAPPATKPGPSQPPGQRPSPETEAPVSEPPGMAAWPSLGGGPGSKGRQKRAPQAQPAPPPGLQGPPPGLEPQPQPVQRPSPAPEAPRVSPPQEQPPAEPRAPGSRHGAQPSRVVPPGRGAQRQPERPESPRVSPAQEQPPSEPQLPRGRGRGPPPGMGGWSQPAQRPSPGPESPRESPPQEPQPAGSRHGAQPSRVVPPGRGAQRQPERPESPRVSPAQEQPPSEPQLPRGRGRGPPPGMGGWSQPAQRPSPGPESPRESPPQEPQPAGARGPPPGMGGRSQPAQRPSEGKPSPRGTAVPQAQPPAQPSGPGAGRAAAVQQITKGISQLALQIPPRKKTGTLGRKIRVATNMLALNLNKLKSNTAIHYDVSFDPDRPKRLLFPAMEELRRRYYPDRYPAFDGRKNLYSSEPLPITDPFTAEVNVRDDESMRDKPYKITVKFASEVDLQSLRTYMRSGSSLQAPQTALQAIDVVLRHAASFSFVKVGRSYFSPPRGEVIDLGDGHEMWYGFFQSAILGWRPFINVDVAHKGFPKPLNCVALLAELFRSTPATLNSYQMDDLRKYLRGLKVEYELPNQPATRRTYRVNDLDKPASDLRFKLDDGKQLTVQQYFEREKRHPLRYPSLPCLWVGSKARENKIFLPLEFCKIVQGQVVQKKMTETQTSNMIRSAATSTDVRKRKIMDVLKTVKLSENETVNGFGLTVSDRFEEIDARILNPPALDYGQKEHPQTVVPSRGVWRPSRFREGSRLTNWAILNLNRQTREDELRRLGSELTKMGKDVGMLISECGSHRTLAAPFRDTRELEQYFRDQKSKGVELVVVVIPEKDVYAKVKQLAEIKVGILTQCIKGRTLFRLTGSTVSNILLKLNSKLNGVNHCLSSRCRPSCLNRPVMIVGADVTHPSPDQTTIPSVAAVSASHDPTAFQYNMEYRLQPARVEIIQDLQNIMRNQLLFFHARTRYKPERIIFYRDGVSEGQFEQVLNAELMAIRRACASLSPDYQPKITFLVVQKRHHTRFFPLRDQDADGKNRNVPPGTVVDTDITHPTELDFYLVSHASIQGVSRPTKYHRLWDDSDMDEDELENLTYYLCHLFTRCARSVSYPAPTYYAHLAAYRARVYLEGHQIQLGNLANEQKLRQTNESFVKNNPMYFV